MAFKTEVVQIKVTQKEKEKLKEEAKKEEKTLSEYLRKKIKLN